MTAARWLVVAERMFVCLCDLVSEQGMSLRLYLSFCQPHEQTGQQQKHGQPVLREHFRAPADSMSCWWARQTGCCSGRNIQFVITSTICWAAVGAEAVLRVSHRVRQHVSSSQRKPATPVRSKSAHQWPDSLCVAVKVPSQSSAPSAVPAPALTDPD